jgi:hypothetical protein
MIMASMVSYLVIFFFAVALFSVAAALITTASDVGGWGGVDMPSSFNKTIYYGSNLENRSRDFQTALGQVSDNTGVSPGELIALVSASVSIAISPLFGILDVGVSILEDFGSFFSIPSLFIGLIVAFLIFSLGGLFIKAITGGGGGIS